MLVSFLCKIFVFSDITNWWKLHLSSTNYQPFLILCYLWCRSVMGCLWVELIMEWTSSISRYVRHGEEQIQRARVTWYRPVLEIKQERSNLVTCTWPGNGNESHFVMFSMISCDNNDNSTENTLRKTVIIINWCMIALIVMKCK